MSRRRPDPGLIAVAGVAAAILAAAGSGLMAAAPARPISDPAASVETETKPPRLGAGQAISGPVTADLVEVVDGDNIRVIAHVWPGHAVSVNVRLRGIDAPEMRTSCPGERRLAGEARAALAALVGSGPVLLVNIAGGKYFGRVVADIRMADGRDIGELMLAKAPVRPYRGARRQAWCP